MSFKTLEKILIEKGWNSEPDSILDISRNPYFSKKQNGSLLNKIRPFFKKNKIFLYDIVLVFYKIKFHIKLKDELKKNPRYIKNLNSIDNLLNLDEFPFNKETLITSIPSMCNSPEPTFVVLDKSSVRYWLIHIKIFSLFPESIEISSNVEDDNNISKEMGQKDPNKPSFKLNDMLEEFGGVEEVRKRGYNISVPTPDGPQAKLQQMIKHTCLMGGYDEATSIRKTQKVFMKLMANPEYLKNLRDGFLPQEIIDTFHSKDGDDNDL